MADGRDLTRLDAALDQALALGGAEREAFLAGLPNDLRRAVGSALSDDALLDHPEVAHALLAEASFVSPGVRVGPYEIGELVGEGGMGRVYRARRADGAYDATVAVKVVRQSLTLAGSNVSTRLRRERAVLAVLDHPGIARLIDGGETADGVPYLVTEFVDGVPVTEWAERQPVRQRVRMLADVARAVDHAHHRLVVHRDLKPSNVLVTYRDGVARPVVLDFGIAKLLAQTGEQALMLTQPGRRILTPAYAAPELADPAAPVTIAADVYGLGALLYEMLAGERPAPRPGRLFVDPPSLLVERRATTGAQRRDARALRGDLDTICLRALHPDPDRRYARAADVAADLERHLSGHPVQARPDTLAYRAGRFVRRHRVGVAAMLVALAAVAMGAGSSWVAWGDERVARQAAEADAERAQEAADLLTNLLAAANPEREGAPDRTVRQALDATVPRVSEIRSGPLRGHLFGRLGEVYAGIGATATADSLFAQALPLLGDTPERTRIRLALADTRSRLGEREAARALYMRLASAHPPSDSLGVLARRGWLTTEQAGPRADSLAAVLVRGARAHGHPALIADARLGRAIYQVWRAERFDAVVPEVRRLRDDLRSLHGPDHRSTRVATSTLAKALAETDRTAEAVQLYRKLIASTVRVHGEGSRDEAYARITLADALRAAQRWAAAAYEYDRGLAVARRTLPAGHEDIGWWEQAAADAAGRTGDAAAAEAHARSALAIGRARGSHPIQARAHGHLGLAMSARRPAEALPHLRRAMALLALPTGIAPSYDREHAELLRRVSAAAAGLGPG